MNFYTKYLLLLILSLTLLTTAFAQQLPQLKQTSDNKKAAETATATISSGKVVFDGEKALAHVRAQVAQGPRWAGSAALKQTRRYIVEQLDSYGLKHHLDTFTATTPNPKFPSVEMANVVAEVPGEESQVIIIASHYDTKWFAEEKFLGANDGGSSTGVLLELARQLAQTKPKYTLWLVFFDGEEAMNGDWTDEDHTYGSRHMVAELQKTGKIKDIKAMILLDMIGDKELTIRKDGNSIGWLKNIFWKTASQAGYQQYFLDEPDDLDDDHTCFIKAGVPAVDIIDFDYGKDNSYWHTTQDTMDKLSAQSLKVVGEVVLLSLPEIAKEIKK